MMNIYADESCKDDHRHLVLGGIAVDIKNLAYVKSRLKEVRQHHNTWGEVKWTKTSKAKLQFYLDFATVFFELNAEDICHFHCLTVDTQTSDRTQDPEIGFNKLIYQLLLHKFGKRYGDTRRLYVYLDDRTTSQKPHILRPMLNSGLVRYKIKSNPFRRVTFMNSSLSDILQVNDLIIGAIGARTNEHHKLPDASPNKKVLGEFISKRARGCELWPMTSRFAKKFTLWQFEYKKGVLKA